MKRDFPMTEEHLNQEVTVALRVRDLLRLGGDIVSVRGAPVEFTEGTPSAELPPIGAEWGGGLYAGVTLDGDQLAALVLLPGEAEDVDWGKAKEWADKQGGYLPSRHDQLVLLKNVKGEFKERYYWSGEQRADDGGCAWFQYFGDGVQDWGGVSFRCHARAVRRATIR